MSQDDKLIDFAAERDKRIHDLHDKKLNDMRDAFAQGSPCQKPRRSPRANPKSPDSSLLLAGFLIWIS